MDRTEKRFERDIESFLISPKGGYLQFNGQDKEGNWIHNKKHDEDKCIFMDVLIEFIENTQPKQWAKYKKYYGDDAPEKLYRRLEDSICNEGLIHVLKCGIEDMGCKIKVCYFQPDSGRNEETNKLYNSNILGCSRQFKYSPKLDNTIDMVLSVNGIPVVAIELKNQLTGQTYEDAIFQFKYRRNENEFCFRNNHRFLAYFAVDLYEAWVATKLQGSITNFRPFNQGSGGAGEVGGAGNPENKNGYATHYLWEQVLQKDSLLDLINKFITVSKDPETKEEKVIFPRYHQYDVVHKVLSDVKKSGPGKNYLIEHSAGSGKSNSIAWIAYRLASAHDSNDKTIFDSVIVVTNRIVLDNQLQETINSFEHVEGLVEAIDQKKNSKNLADAINDKKRITICTIQKFLFAYKDMEKIKGRNFAIIVDEAHQGQSGDSAKTLKKSLIDLEKEIKEYAEIEGIDPEEVELDSDFVLNVLGQGKHKNQSFFAFTATAKEETLEFFGTKQKGIDLKKPFHVYSMRQAIEEEYILDVLENYTTVKEAFKLIKTSEDDPEVFEGPAAKILYKYYKEHGFTIKQKTEMIMSNFLQNGRFSIHNDGKCMVVADSRANAVRYYLAIKQYLKNHPKESKGCNVLIAFSGTVNVDGVSYKEKEMNIDFDGHQISSDKKFRKAFRSYRYNIMVVANKYQTGFDEPLLQSMYIDKRLKGVNAVQTLSRLNRTCHGKDKTFVLDFKNKIDEIKDSFQPYYESTNLEGTYNLNKVYDFRNKISKFMLYSFGDVDRFKKLMDQQSGKKQSDIALGQLSSMFKPVIERYTELDEDEQHKAKSYINKFIKSYNYVTQLVSLHDEELFKEYLFCMSLIKFIPKKEYKMPDIDDKIKLEYASLKETYTGAITLDKKSINLTPKDGDIVSKPERKKDTLQSIIEKVNMRFEGNFSEGDRVIIEGIFKKFMSDPEVKKFKKYAKENNTQMFVESLFPDKFKNIVTQCYIENNDSFKKLFEDTEFYKNVMEAMAKEIYKSLNREDK